MSEFEQLFPSLEGPPYLNHAAIAPIPRSVAQAVQEVVDDQLNSGGHRYEHWLANEQRLRRNLAELLQARRPDDIALLPNTASGISTLAEGLDWQAGDEVVLPAEEFPSNRLPWMAQKHRGITITEVPWHAVPEDGADHDPEADLMAACGDRTRVLAISAVAWHNGFRFDLQRLGRFCRDHDILFCVDAIQHLGALTLDVDRCHIDCLAAGSHKWLLCPEGSAVFYTTPELRSRLRPSRHGWRMTDQPFEFNKTAWQASESARQYEPGTGNNLGIAAMAAATGLMLDTGPSEIQQRVLDNRNHLADGIAGIEGARLLCSQVPDRRSGIIVFTHPGLKRTESALEEAGIAFALRGGGVRLSPHFYQSRDLMEQALEVIRSAI